MNEITIRKATQKDLEQLYVFEQGVIAAERPFDPTLKEDPIHYYDLEDMIHAPHIHLVIAETEDKVIASGYARIEQAKPYVKHKTHAYLGFMYVLPEHRGKGINKRIIETLQSWSHAQGVNELSLDVYFGNTPAIRAYEKIGFSKHMIEMRMNKADE